LDQVFLQLLIENGLGRGVRREFLMGRHWLVASVTMLVPGVLNGSGGRLLYRPERVGANPSAWDAMPLTNGHPTIDGKPVSARTPEVLEKYGLGMLLRSRFDNALRGEAWFDAERLREVGPKTLEALESGRPIEVSTGLFLSRTKAEDGAVYNGVAYEYDTDNYNPDHLAILMDTKGACSNKDGCGINNSSNKNTPAHDGGIMDKTQQIQWLTTNCECWKDRAGTLNKLADDEVKGIFDSAQAAHQRQTVLTEQVKAVTNALGVESLPAAGEIPALVKSKTTVVTNTTVVKEEPKKPENFGEALKLYGNDQDRNTWETAQRISAQYKTGLVEKVVNALGRTDDAKAQLRSIYSKQPVSDLEAIVKHLPAEPTANQLDNVPRYLPDAQQPSFGVEINQDDSLVPTGYLD